MDYGGSFPLYIYIWCTWAEGSSALLWSRVVRRPSSLTFHIFDFFSETTERNSKKLDRKQDLNVLYQVCVFRADQKKDDRHCLWLAETFLTSFLKPLNGIQRNLTGSKITMSSTIFVFFGPIGKTRWPPCPLTVETVSTFSPLKPLNGIQRNLTGSKISMSSTKFVFFFRDINWKNKMAALASDWLRHFRPLLLNRHTEFNETSQEARSQRPLPRLCFSGRSEIQYCRPGFWLAETFSTFSPLKPMNGIQRNLTGSKI